jgi:hypothetical protein
MMAVPKRNPRQTPAPAPHELEIGERDPLTGAILVSRRDPSWTRWTFESDIVLAQPIDVCDLLGRTDELGDLDDDVMGVAR